MRPSRGVAAVLAAAALIVLPVLPATAHDELTAATPEPGAVLETAPDRVELTFSGEVMDIGHEVQVTDSAGRSVTDGPPEPQGHRVVQPLAGTDAPDESYRVVWRVVSGDGHPIEGTFRYEVVSGGAPTAAPGAEPAATPGEPAGEPAEPAGEPAEPAGDAAGPPVALLAVAGAAAAVAVLVALSLASRRRRRD